MDLLKTIYAFGFILALQSCSIKEDRGPCPCHLNVNVERCSAFTDRLMLSAWKESRGNLFTDRIKLTDYPDVYSRKVDKGFIYVSAFSGYERMMSRDGFLIIPEGEECPEIMAFRGELLDASGDSIDEHVCLHKQYSRIFFLTDEVTESMGEMVFRVVGNVNGFSLSSLYPCEGKFSAIAAKKPDGVRSLCVPRQIDDDLKLEIYMDGVLYGTICIGDKIRESGYSWEEEDLCDIYLSICLFSSSGISVDVNGWDTEIVQYTI